MELFEQPASAAGPTPAGAAGRPHAAARARRGRRPGAPAGAGPGPARGDRERRAALDDPVGTAGLGQDHAGLADGARGRRALRGVLGRALRRQGDPRGRRRGGRRASPPAAEDHPVRRRDPSLQPRPAGRLPAPRREGHDRADRRHHRESVVRGELRAAVPLPRLRAARRSRKTICSRSCAARWATASEAWPRLGARGQRRRAAVDRAPGQRRRALGAQRPGAGRAAGARRRAGAASSPTRASARRRRSGRCSTTSRARSTTT